MVELTYEMAQKALHKACKTFDFCSTQQRYSRRNRVRRYWHELKIEFYESKEWWRFTVIIPRYDPEALTVRGCTKNPRYTSSTKLRHEMKEKVRNRVAAILREVLAESEAWQAEQDAADDEYMELRGG
jgi:hypothetical protein